MYIKSATVLPPGFKVTRLPVSTKKVKSTYSLLKAEERRLGEHAELKLKANRITQAIKDGYTVAEAIKLLSE